MVLWDYGMMEHTAVVTILYYSYSFLEQLPLKVSVGGSYYPAFNLPQHFIHEDLKSCFMTECVQMFWMQMWAQVDFWLSVNVLQVCVRRQQARRTFHQKQRRLLQLLPPGKHLIPSHPFWSLYAEPGHKEAGRCCENQQHCRWLTVNQASHLIGHL